MHKVTAGLVLRETNYRDADKILTVLTRDEGKITVAARGVRRKGSKLRAAAQILAFSEMTLFEYRGRYSLNEAALIEPFLGLREDIGKFALAAYFAELMEALSDEDRPSTEILSLGLNGIYLLSEGKRDERLVKAAFELRIMCLAGYLPDLHSCSDCGEEEVEAPMLDIRGGRIYCKKCLNPNVLISMPICGASLMALRHVSEAEDKKIFSFELGSEPINRFSSACEAYTLAQMERGFKTLDYYKKFLISEGIRNGT